MGWASALDSDGRTIWIADAHRGDGKRFVVRADEKRTAFAQLEATLRDCDQVNGTTQTDQGHPFVSGVMYKRRLEVRTTNLEKAAIRIAVLKAAAQERRKSVFKLSGRGHEPRITLSGGLAYILRGFDVPRVAKAGRGPRYYYPRRVFDRATRILKKNFGNSPIYVDHYWGCAWVSVHDDLRWRWE